MKYLEIASFIYNIIFVPFLQAIATMFFTISGAIAVHRGYWNGWLMLTLVGIVLFVSFSANAALAKGTKE